MAASLLFLFFILLLNPAIGLIFFFLGILGFGAFTFVANDVATQF